MFWLGLAVGLVVGANLGAVIMGCLVVAKRVGKTARCADLDLVVSRAGAVPKRTIPPPTEYDGGAALAYALGNKSKIPSVNQWPRGGHSSRRLVREQLVEFGFEAGIAGRRQSGTLLLALIASFSRSPSCSALSHSARVSPGCASLALAMLS